MRCMSQPADEPCDEVDERPEGDLDDAVWETIASDMTSEDW